MLAQKIIFTGAKLECGIRIQQNLRKTERPWRGTHAVRLSPAINRKPLRLDSRPSVRRRRDIEIGNVFVFCCRPDQQRRIAPKVWFDVPARDVAPHDDAIR